MKQSELVRALRAELAATEKELADQKWVFQQFLQSPAWRWTAPIRWFANRFRPRRNGHSEAQITSLEDLQESEDVVTNLELNASITGQRRLSLDTFLASGM